MLTWVFDHSECVTFEERKLVSVKAVTEFKKLLKRSREESWPQNEQAFQLAWWVSRSSEKPLEVGRTKDQQLNFHINQIRIRERFGVTKSSEFFCWLGSLKFLLETQRDDSDRPLLEILPALDQPLETYQILKLALRCISIHYKTTEWKSFQRAGIEEKIQHYRQNL